MSLDMLFEILGTLERLAAGWAFMRFERDMDSDMRGDMVPFDGRGFTVTPLAGQIEVVSALPTDMALADVFLKDQY